MQWEQLLAVLSGSANNDDYVTVLGNDNNIWMASEGDASAVLGNYLSTTQVAQSAWVCVELDVMLATTGSTAVVYVADQEIVTATLVTPSPGYSSIRAGLWTGVSGGGATVYVDDVVVAAQHIGCQ